MEKTGFFYMISPEPLKQYTGFDMTTIRADKVIINAPLERVWHALVDTAQNLRGGKPNDVLTVK